MSAVMQQHLDVAPFAFEKVALDRWAVWREQGFLDLPRSTHILARLAELGMPTQISGYVHQPETSDVGQHVQVFMVALARDFPAIHRCLEARHRRVIGAIRIGLKRNERTGRLRAYFDNEVAVIAMGPGDANLMQYRRLCEQGYLRLRSWMKR